jgi:fatty acid desaturase
MAARPGRAGLPALTAASGSTALAIVFIAPRQQALLVLIHEFLAPAFSWHRAVLNNALGDLLTALPFLIAVYCLRRAHAAHHADTFSDCAHRNSIKGYCLKRLPHRAIGANRNRTFTALIA